MDYKKTEQWVLSQDEVRAIVEAYFNVGDGEVESTLDVLFDNEGRCISMILTAIEVAT